MGYLEDYKYHAVFSIAVSSIMDKNPGELAVDLFRLFTTEEMISTMATNIIDNMDNDKNKKRSTSAVENELAIMNITARYRNNTELCCVHTEFPLTRDDLETHLKHGVGKDKIHEFVRETRLAM